MIELNVLVLSGDARVLKDEYVKNIVLEKNLTRIKIDIDDAQRISEILSQNNLFASFLIDVVDYSSWKKEDQKQFLEKIETASIPVVVRTSSPIKDFESMDFSLPKPWEREKWLEYIKERLKKRSLSFDTDALEMFFDMVGPDDLLIEREIEKLACVDKKITSELVKEFVFNHSKLQIDELCFSISSGNQEQSHKILSMILSHAEPVLIVNALCKHFIDLYKILSVADRRESYSWVYIKDISQKLDIPVVRAARMMGFTFKGQPRAINHLQIYDFEKLESILNQLQSLDREIKSSENKTIPIHLFIEFVCQTIGDRP
ncbi:MAG TPA: hypothetical protein VIL29_01520 [Pseudothermotoga sp.]